MSQENVELVRRGVALWNIAAGDADDATWRRALREMTDTYHPDAELDFSRTTPDFAPTRGREAMIAWVEAARETVAAVAVEATDLIDGGDAVIVAMRITATGAMSGANAAMEFAYVFEIHAQQIKSATTYGTMAEALRAVGLEE